MPGTKRAKVASTPNVEAVPQKISKTKSKAVKPTKDRTEPVAKKAKTQLKPDEEFDEDSAEENGAEADQAAALLAGFESSSEEEEEQADGLALDKIPAAPLSEESKLELRAAKKHVDEEPGTIYIGHLPHGFYEPQMKAYFSQFGTLTKLRMAKNKTTGRSKHFAFAEFESAEVADIVARTMNKYLMFGHILEVQVVPKERIHSNLWKNAGRRFKVVPRNKIQGRWLREPKSKEVWDKRIGKEEEKRKAKAEKLKEMGYDFEMPSLKKVIDVEPRAVNAEEGEPPKAIEAAPEEKLEEQPVAEDAEQESSPIESSKKRKSTGSTTKADAEPAKVKKPRTKEPKTKKSKT